VLESIVRQGPSLPDHPIRHVFADEGFAGRLVDGAAIRLQMTVEIVSNGFWWAGPSGCSS
jgi:hypothetical protein